MGGVKTLLKRLGRKHLRFLIESCGERRHEIGAHAIGAVEVFQKAMLEDWNINGWLQNDSLSSFNIPADGLTGLLTIASGYKLHDIGGPNGLIDVTWRGLPRHPMDILQSGVYVTHSVRSFQELDEHAIRSFFLNHRIDTKKSEFTNHNQIGSD